MNNINIFQQFWFFRSNCNLQAVLTCCGKSYDCQSIIISSDSNLLGSHCVKSVQIRSFFWSLFSRIRTEYGEILRMDQKKLRIWTLFTQCQIAILHRTSSRRQLKQKKKEMDQDRILTYSRVNDLYFQKTYSLLLLRNDSTRKKHFTIHTIKLNFVKKTISMLYPVRVTPEVLSATEILSD